LTLVRIGPILSGVNRASLVLGLAALSGVLFAAPATSGSGAVFQSPSGNIHCRYFPSVSTIGCVTLNNRLETMMRAAGQPYTQAMSHRFPGGSVLAYGQSRQLGGKFTCTSRKDGIACRSLVSGRCFLARGEGTRLGCSTSPVRSDGRSAQPSKSTADTSGATANCHPSYKGACLDPNASDYDCAGGSGNGPKYTGPVQVVGPDDFDLDRDGDGYACEDG
jgi:hypothetical protein